MSRLLVLFFALLLPLQFAWAGAAAYCQHESTAGAAHFGHHEHVHQGADGTLSDSKPAAHPDCATCQAAASPLIVDMPLVAPAISLAARLAPPGRHRLASAVGRTPDRPQWPRLA